MPATAAARLKEIRTFALSLPGTPPSDTIKRWVMESYRAQAPKRVLRELEATQPWVAAGALPR
jgi:hypothetical protein